MFLEPQDLGALKARNCNRMLRLGLDSNSSTCRRGHSRAEKGYRFGRGELLALAPRSSSLPDAVQMSANRAACLRCRFDPALLSDGICSVIDLASYGL